MKMSTRTSKTLTVEQLESHHLTGENSGYVLRRQTGQAGSARVGNVAFHP